MLTSHTPTRCDVSDALVKLGIANGGFLPGITMWSPQRQDGATKIVGPAYPVQYAPKDDERPKWPTHYVSHLFRKPRSKGSETERLTCSFVRLD